MAKSLIHLDEKHILVYQLQMFENQILDMYIRKLPAPPSSLIKPYLRDARFLHVTRMGKGCKLDSTLISTLVERWRPETHTFHFPYNGCTITLEDVQL
ncbi:hypothetical protein PVK06_040021 [Gossypium arboreum]|uniref:Aminotransferase-like plant mobile domain-containing protein n=1 Tax=Gossypium arboreum TaxID=29729 RepID=A0ABR0N4D3_GOSAR|nr:hypothetical protein PVK06_040021 [Gossypium arboreum]